MDPLCIIIILLGKQILVIWGEEFIQGYSILVILAIGQFFNIASGPVGNLLAMANQEIVLKNITIITLLVNVLMNYLLINYYGALGAAIATSGTIIINMILCSLYVKIKLKFTPFL